MDSKLTAHLKTLLIYVCEDEFADYCERGKPEGHIYEDIEPLVRYLEEQGVLKVRRNEPPVTPMLDHSSWPEHIRNSVR